jgi:DNA-binding protein WhiA
MSEPAMGYHADVKSRLSKIIEDERDVSESELYGLLQGGIVYVMKGKGQIALTFETEMAAVARKFYALVRQLFSAKTEIKKIERNDFGPSRYYSVDLIDSEACMEILRYFDMVDLRNGFELQRKIDDGFLADEEMKRAYLRGVFLSSGYIADPSRSFLLEFRLRHESYADDFCAFLRTFSLSPLRREKKNTTVVYLKKAEEISTVLALMGGYESMLQFEDRIAMKNMKNKMQRLVNCDTANLNKTIEVSLRQQYAINKIIRQKGLSTLPEHLVQAAQLRLDYPESSLSEMAQAAEPPISRSTLDKRLKKIMQIAENLR